MYAGAEELFNLCHQPALSNDKLGAVLAELTTAFIGEALVHDTDSRLVVAPNWPFSEEFRRKTFVLLSKAYTSIYISLAQRYLGLPIDQILSGA